MITTPIAVFTYNRPEHTHQMLAALAACARLDECDIVIFSDAPQVPEHAQGVDETRNVIRSWVKHHAARVVERSENWGLARSIVDGVSELCEQFGRVIVVEDDLLVHPAFIHFMLSALDRYADDERVAQITGYMFPVQNSSTPDAFFLPFISTWGWGTWSRAWKLFNWDASSALTELQDPERQRLFDLEGCYPYTKMLLRRLEGKNHSWGILFYWAVFQARKLALYPRQSLVDNIGFDGGTHYHKNTVKFTPISHTDVFLAADVHPVWPDSSVVDMEAYRRIQQYLKNALKPQPSRSNRLWSLLRRFRIGNL